jgi:hypothetical protein
MRRQDRIRHNSDLAQREPTVRLRPARRSPARVMCAESWGRKPRGAGSRPRLAREHTNCAGESRGAGSGHSRCFVRLATRRRGPDPWLGTGPPAAIAGSGAQKMRLSVTETCDLGRSLRRYMAGDQGSLRRGGGVDSAGHGISHLVQPPPFVGEGLRQGVVVARVDRGESPSPGHPQGTTSDHGSLQSPWQEYL